MKNLNQMRNEELINLVLEFKKENRELRKKLKTIKEISMIGKKK